MTASRLVLVDTNCFLRLYSSPVMPLLGEVVGGYHLLTLQSLIDEFMTSPRLTGDYKWVTVAPKGTDLTAGALILSSVAKGRVTKQKAELKPYVDAFVRNMNAKKRMSLTPLSRRDLDLLATAVVMKAIIATDERALQEVAFDLMEDKASYQIDVLNSFQMLHFLENNGRLDSSARRNTVDAWIKLKERLPMGWRSKYEELFGEVYVDC